MADPIEILAAKKASILAEAEAHFAEAEAKLLQAQARAAEIDLDAARLQEMSDLAAKYGLTVVAGDPAQSVGSFSDAVPSHATSATQSRSRNGESQQALAIKAAEELIRAAGKPLSLDQLYPAIIGRGIKLGGERPRSTLSAYLSNGTAIESIRKGWWWLRNTPIPPKHTVGISEIVERRI